MYLILDSSVFVAALVESEEKHIVCRKILESVKDGKFVTLEPYTVLVEVVAAIRRRTGSDVLAERVKQDLQNIGNIYFFELVSLRAEKAAHIAAQTGLRGMDSIVVQIANEFNGELVTLDEEIEKKASKIVKIKHIR